MTSDAEAYKQLALNLMEMLVNTQAVICVTAEKPLAAEDHEIVNKFMDIHDKWGIVEKLANIHLADPDQQRGLIENLVPQFEETKEETLEKLRDLLKDHEEAKEKVEKLNKLLEEKEGVIKLLGEASAKLGEKAEKAEKEQGNLQGALEHMQMKVDVKQSAIKCVERVVKRMEEQLKKEKQEKQEITHQLSDVLICLSQRDQEILELKKQNEEIKTLREDVKNLKKEMQNQKLKFESDTDYLLNLSNHEAKYLENQVKNLEAEVRKLRESSAVKKDYDFCDDIDEPVERSEHNKEMSFQELRKKVMDEIEAEMKHKNIVAWANNWKGAVMRIKKLEDVMLF
ncbi:hypothetical protein GCK72_015859 [Caenorhabditis remanei]|uniref:Uncharacterized protein n=1 Tax=Caenorhabditis remanei TaxID=31234 RepID=A0A6A5GYL2_CAERE|nr:hypothetical protein GCK72_015859 [Caenorhabditis remanei]KAF1759392.1 hypothetical protein GCK72_015859 [Caenorhabditis remanei]